MKIVREYINEAFERKSKEKQRENLLFPINGIEDIDHHDDAMEDEESSDGFLPLNIWFKNGRKEKLFFQGVDLDSDNPLLIGIYENDSLRIEAEIIFWRFNSKRQKLYYVNDILKLIIK